MYLGIDFGTSFSKISTMYLESPTLLMDPGEYGIPSEFYYDRMQGDLVGQDALDAGQGADAKNLVSEVKMAIMDRRSYTLDGRQFMIEEIIKSIYRSIVLKAKHNAGKLSLNPGIEGAVISVPAGFGMKERDMIYQAAKNCLGTDTVKIMDIIREPVAAALAYHKTELNDGKYFIVFDLGGGTCDIALLKADQSRREHYDVVGEPMMLRLGGRNWDEKLEEYLAERIEAKTGVRIRGNVALEEKIRRAAITVKHQLSEPMRDRSTARVEINNRMILEPVTRKIFDEITLPLLNQTMNLLQDFYDMNSVLYQIEEIICVGGSSNMPQIKEAIEARFPKCSVRVWEPEHAVVKGAAVYADLLSKRTGGGEVVLQDYSAFSYGVRIFRDYEKKYKAVSNVIKKGDRLPADKMEIFHPVEDNQSSVYFAIYESDRKTEYVELTDPTLRHVGDLRIELPPNSPESLRLECNMRLNSMGLLEVRVTLPSGKEVKSSFQIR